MTRRILLVVHPHRPEAQEAASLAAAALEADGIATCTDFERGVDAPIEAALVLGGDGTILHAADMTRGTGIPLLGVNLGHVGFLAELERDDVAHAARRLAAGEYDIEERGTLDVVVTLPTGEQTSGWALNDVTIERANLRTTIEVALDIDDHPLSTFGCDGVVISSATGSTAHAFSAGGPVLWPDVDALLVVPLAAHALFSRPLVVSPSSQVRVEILDRSSSDGQVVLDGARALDLARGGRVEVSRGSQTVRLARMSDAPFSERLVQKFALPVDGFRGERPISDSGAGI
ncbi:NAD kinase [Demequina mangrovi]|uniref:NAD kinase n=1 Tax=Demequina mangrovi TaxID=1043493 RepID=A0A1H7B1N4_9MICO|nr:NAD kinase [Demequina mangrovi]SEJ70127.1 NAD+ kinase [Demequina mangrovi]